MNRIILLAIMLAVAPQLAHADIIDPQIAVLKSGEAIVGGEYRDGWIVSGSANSIGRINATPNLRADRFGAQPDVFNIGDTIVLCFRPSTDMNVTVTDISPQGKITQLFPYPSGTVRATANVEHCIGEKNSAVTLTMDQPSGIGSGKVYIVGVPVGETPPMIDAEEDLPGGFGGAMSRSVKGRTLWEAWIEYRVGDN